MKPKDQRNHPIFRSFARPVAFHRIFVTLTDSVTSALMLSQAIYWSERTKDPAGWFYKTQEEWEEETGLTRREQETARKRLRKFDWWQEELRKANGVPTMHYRIDADGFAQSVQSGLAESAKPRGLAESAKPDCTNAPNPLTETTYRDYSKTTSSVSHSLNGQDVDFYQGKGETTRTEEDVRHDEQQAREWEEMAVQSEAQRPKANSALAEEIAAWAKQQRILDKAPDDVKETSYLLWQKTGFVPKGKLSAWVSAVRDLQNAARSDMQVLMRGVSAGEEARAGGKLTFSGPRSYISFVSNEAANADLARRKIVRKVRIDAVPTPKERIRL